MKANLGTLFAMLFLTSCSSQTYDDCLLSGMEGKNSDRAVTAVEDSCRRKFEIRVRRNLEIQPSESELSLESLEKGPSYLVTNIGPNIVTQIDVTSTEGQWTINTWIEPDRWDTFDVPTKDSEGFMKSLRAAKVKAAAVKEIPTK